MPPHAGNARPTPCKRFLQMPEPNICNLLTELHTINVQEIRLSAADQKSPTSVEMPQNTQTADT